MTFSELEHDYLIDITREQVIVNVISLLRTIESCEDVIKARIEDYKYDSNDYAIKIATTNRRPKNEYIIWYRYIDDINEELISNNLYTAGQPDPDLLIRTSGECRISNFLLWQLSYAELYFTDCLWPDFDKEELFKAFQSYQGRKRRFGGLNKEEQK